VEVRYLPTGSKRFGVLELHKGDDGFWRLADGTIIAVPDVAHSVDPVARCGVWPVALPASHKLTRVCRPHDYMYSSPVWQTFHYREEADQWLEENAEKISGSLVGETFGALSRIFGWFFWENEKTR